jgi:presenilin 1
MSTHARDVQHSILDDLGEEVTGILTPVSVCMALTVMLVKTLNPTGASDARSVYIASAFYSEKVSRSSCSRLYGI